MVGERHVLYDSGVHGGPWCGMRSTCTRRQARETRPSTHLELFPGTCGRTRAVSVWRFTVTITTALAGHVSGI